MTALGRGDYNDCNDKDGESPVQCAFPESRRMVEVRQRLRSG
ncbi:hypothetical protein HMPREF0262_00815 [Clostridium sp. ATCC 29733]|nr:hypothetical protein HMPREF0262_00815 [Clostridium sp. ATCC 29733]